MSSDAIASYLETFDKLRTRKRWSTDTTVFRYVALSLGSIGLDDPYGPLERAAEILKKRAGWTSPLRSEIRYLVAAMILSRGVDAARVHARVVETRDGFREHKVPRGGTGPTLAALLMALHWQGRPVSRRHVERLAHIYRRWRDEHFWLTGKDDLPAAAIHAMRDESVDALAANVERSYQQLRAAGFRRGNQLQLVSQLLAVDPRGAGAGVQRFRRVAEALRRKRERVGTSRYDEIAVLALTRSEPTPLVSRVLGYRDRLRAARPRPSKDVAFSLAAGIALAEDTDRARRDGAGDLAALRSLQAILDAQQAAVTAAIVAGSVVATTAATGS